MRKLLLMLLLAGLPVEASENPEARALYEKLSLPGKHVPAKGSPRAAFSSRMRWGSILDSPRPTREWPTPPVFSPSMDTKRLLR